MLRLLTEQRELNDSASCPNPFSIASVSYATWRAANALFWFQESAVRTCSTLPHECVCVLWILWWWTLSDSAPMKARLCLRRVEMNDGFYQDNHQLQEHNGNASWRVEMSDTEGWGLGPFHSRSRVWTHTCSLFRLFSICCDENSEITQMKVSMIVCVIISIRNPEKFKHKLNKTFDWALLL